MTAVEPTSATRARPLLAVDDIRLEPGAGALASKLIRAEDPYLKGHYPGAPLYPGVFSLETIRQAVALQLRAAGGADLDVRVLEVVSLRLLRPLLPGDVASLELPDLPAQEHGNTFAVTAVVTADGRPAARLKARFEVTALGGDGD